LIQSIHGVCPHDCPDTCSFITEVKDNRAVNLYGDPHHPITQGWLCAKVRPYLEHVYHPDRLLYPLKRVGPKGSGQWARLSWDEAIAEIAERWQQIIARYGAAAILPYSYSGTLGLVQMSVTNGRFWNRLGASRLQRAICGNAAETAVEATLGARHSPSYEEVAHSRLILIWGHNPASTAPHFMPSLTAAQREGCQVVVIDPRRTRTARGADWHVAPLPGSDGALALGMAHVIVAEKLHQPDWLKNHTVGGPEFQERLVDYPPSRVAAITGLKEKIILDLARRYATTTPSLIKISDGLQRNLQGGQTIRAICALPALTGQYGLRGGGLAYSTSGYLQWDKAALHHWDECPPPSRSVNMNRLGAALTGEVTDPPILSLYVFGANPMASSPNVGLIAQGLQRPDLFTVVHELFLTDTADMADLVLPTTSQLEQTDLHKGYGHTYLAYNQAAIAPLGECKSNWEVMGLLATAMGFHETWLHQTADEVITEILTATAAHNSALSGITLDKLKSGEARPLAIKQPPFADLNFPTPSGKVELYSTALVAQGLEPLPSYLNMAETESEFLGKNDLPALTLLTGAAHHFVSSSLANQGSLLAREGVPFLEIHPTDATARHIANGDGVMVENERGSCQLQAIVTDTVRPGVVVSPKGRWGKLDPFATNGQNGRNINWLTSDALGDMAGQSTFHSTRVWVRRKED